MRTAKHLVGKETSQLPEGHINVKQFCSIKAAHAIVVREQEGPMSLIEQDEFKAAFVVFVMSSLLAPSSKHDRVSDDYMHIIAQLAQINSYDWAEYVLRCLLEAEGRFSKQCEDAIHIWMLVVLAGILL